MGSVGAAVSKVFKIAKLRVVLTVAFVLLKTTRVVNVIFVSVPSDENEIFWRVLEPVTISFLAGLGPH